MEKTPLELYETAYKLHYVENRIAEAVKYYEALVKEFPDSDECGYAAIQLQKIKASDIAEDLKVSSKSGPASTIAIILSLLSLIFSGLAAYYFYQQDKLDSVRAKLTVNALGKIFRGEHEEALKNLTELKILAKNDIMPFELSADIYRKLKQYDKARSEYEIFYKLNPGLQPTEDQLQKMKQDEIDASNARRQPPPPPVQVAENVSENEGPKKAVVAPKKPAVQAPKPKAAVKKQPPKEQKKIKSLFLVDPDSISYF